MNGNEEKPPLATTRESPLAMIKTKYNQKIKNKYINQFFKKRTEGGGGR